MWQRRITNRRRWCLVISFVILSVAISGAQNSVRRGADENETQEQSSRREKMRSLRESHLRTTGTTIWDGGLGENEASLPVFGISHTGNRRKLQSSFGDFILDQETYDRYGIGVRPLKPEGQQRPKSSKKGNGKGKGKGKGSPSRPEPAPTPSQPQPRPTPPLMPPVIPPVGPPNNRPPSVGPPNKPPSQKPPNKSPTPEPPSTPGNGCRTEFTVDFLQLSAIPPALFVDPSSPDEQTLGTRYVYNDGLRDQDTLDELLGSNVQGTCTRTQARVGSESVGLQLGGGHCQFTYVLKNSQNREIVFTASGDVVDSLGGILSITGGSKSTVGAYGEIELLPVNLGEDGQLEIEKGDFFLDPLFYAADARIFVPC